MYLPHKRSEKSNKRLAAVDRVKQKFKPNCSQNIEFMELKCNGATRIVPVISDHVLGFVEQTKGLLNPIVKDDDNCSTDSDIEKGTQTAFRFLIEAVKKVRSSSQHSSLDVGRLSSTKRGPNEF